MKWGSVMRAKKTISIWILSCFIIPSGALAACLAGQVCASKIIQSSQSKVSMIGLPTSLQQADLHGAVQTPQILPGTFVALPSGINPASLGLQTPFAAAPGGMYLNPGSPTNPSGH